MDTYPEISECMKLSFSKFFSGLLILFVYACHGPEKKSVETVNLDKGWVFQYTEDGKFYPAEVPGCIHTDLMANHLIEDPYFRDNEAKVQWVGEKDWVYEKNFDADAELFNYDKLELIFEGLDTYADVYLNDTLLLKADNMFREWLVNVKDRIVPGKNKLKIVFHSPLKINREKALQHSYALPDERAWSRKAPYMFGWDWGPVLVTSGIWKPVYLRAWNGARIDALRIKTIYMDSLQAEIRVSMEILSKANTQASCIIDIQGNNSISKKINLKKGSNFIDISFNIDKPKLWWTHNLGEPYLYHLKARIKSDGDIFDEVSQSFGIRKIELVQEDDSIGRSFYFRLNGKAVFMKGANYVPQDNFPARVGPERYHRLISNVLDANMNMLRVWGGGIYENDLFYDLCDSAGILIWQDFMFACTMYPGDSSFLNNVKQEAVQNVKRLRNHPCIALWCGNNEVDEGWKNWGWQKQFKYTEAEQQKIWGDYKDLFDTLLPEVIHKYDGTRSYWPSSPSIGWGHPESLKEGDSHYWGVWWGHEPFDIFEKKVGRFMSEYGFQGYPPMKTIEAFTLPADRVIGSPVMKAHQKHPFGEELIREYMQRDYPVPTDLETYDYLSQLNQAEGIRKAIEADRRAMPVCMGTLYWQLNDCWPVISWSGFDYYYRKKALHYFVKKAFRNVLISPVAEDGFLNIYIISDLMDTVSSEMTMSLQKMDGSELWHKDTMLNILPLKSLIYFRRALNKLVDKNMEDKVYLKVWLNKDNGILSDNTLYFSPVKELNLQKPMLSIVVSPENNVYSIHLNSKNLVKNIYLSTSLEGEFSDNFFDLYPGINREIKFIPAYNNSAELKIGIQTVNDLLSGKNK